MRRDSGVRALAKVTIGVALQRGLGALLIIVLLVLVTRGEGLDAAALIGITAAVVMTLAAAIDFGSTPASLRDFAVAPPSRTAFCRLLRLKLVVAVGVGGLFAAGAAAFGSGQWPATLAAGALALPAIGTTALATSKLATDGGGLRLGLGALVALIVGVSVAAAFTLLDSRPAALMLALPAARAAEAVFLLASCSFPVMRADRVRYDASWWLGQWQLGVFTLLQVVYLRGQVIVPGLVLATAKAGEVSNGFNLYSAGTLLPGAIGLATWGAIARRLQRSDAEGLRLAARASALALLATLPVAALTLAVPGAILRTLFHTSSPSLEAYLRWVALAMLFAGPNGMMLSALVGRGRQGLVAFQWAAGATAAVTAQVILSGAFGVAGSGAAVLIAEASLMLLFGGALVRRPAISALAGGLRKPAAALGATIVAACVAGAIAAVVGTSTAFPDARSGLLSLLVVPVVLIVVFRASGYDLLAPAAIFSLSWTAALGLAQVAFYPSFTWSAEMWALVTVPPLVMAAFAAMAAGAEAFGGTRSRRAMRQLRRPLLATSGLIVLGMLGWVAAYSELGVIPLLSGQVDATRFNQFNLFSLLATRAGQVAFIVALFFAITTPGRARWPWVVVAFGICVPIFLSGGRLNLVSGVASAGIAVVLWRGMSRRTVVLATAAAAVIVVGSSSLWFFRIDQQADNPFKRYLEERLEPGRPAWLQWTIPVQLAATGSMHTLADIVETEAYDTGEPGYYSLRALDRFVPAKDLETVARDHARFGYVTTTYLGDVYADGGLTACVMYSAVLGVLYGLLYRWYRRSASMVPLFLYAYCAFWLVFAIFLGYWQVHGVWIVDIPILLLIGYMASHREPRAGRFPVMAPSAAPQPLGDIGA